MKLRYSVLSLAISAALLTQPALALSSEQRLERLERRVAKVTELMLQLDTLQRENRQLRGDLESLQHELQRVKRKQRDIYQDMDQRLSDLTQSGAATPAVAAGPGSSSSEPETPAADASTKSPEKEGGAPVTDRTGNAGKAKAENVVQQAPVNPADAQAEYKAAYDLLSPSQRKYKDAAKAFSAFLERHPGSVLASNAQYWLAEAHYVSQENDQALSAFQKVVANYPDSPKVPGALYKIGRIQHVKGNLKEARKALQQVIKQYPDASAAGLAKERLAQIKRGK